MFAEIRGLSAASRTARRSPAVGRLPTLIVSAVWLLHGGYNKLLGGSPRHLAIVQSVPGLDGIAGERALVVIGGAEVLIAAWVMSGLTPYLCAVAQTVLLVAMNLVELHFARHLLLWPAGLLPINLAFLALAWTAAAAQGRDSLRVRLRRHPLAMRAHFDDCLTLTYAVPANVLRPLVPPGLDLETSGGYGFLAVALVQTRALRPAGVPRAVGHDFCLIGYRVFVRFRAADGRTIRGLRILRSDTDRAAMVIGGNLLTHYNYHPCDARITSLPDRVDAVVRTPGGTADVELTALLNDDTLPAGSPFASVREARRFAGPLPFTFDYEEETHAIVAIEARRQNWTPRPVAASVRRLAFFDQPVFRGCTPVLAAAFHIRDVEYRWERGVLHHLSDLPAGDAA